MIAHYFRLHAQVRPFRREAHPSGIFRHSKTGRLQTRNLRDYQVRKFPGELVLKEDHKEEFLGGKAK